MPAARFQGIRIAGYLALVAAMACFGLALFMSDVWAAGFAVGGLLLVWFAHRVIDAPGRAAKAAAAEDDTADAPVKAMAPPFNFATVSDDDDVHDHEDDHDHDDEDAPAPPPRKATAHDVPAAAPVVVAIDTPLAATPAATPPRMRTLEEVRADMALLRQAVRASRPVPAPQDQASTAPAPVPAPAPAPAPQAPPRPRPVVDLFARTEVAGLEVSYAPGTDEEGASFPRTQLVGLERDESQPHGEFDADFPRTQFERPA